MTATTLTQSRLKELFQYDPASGLFVWKQDRRAGVKAGDVAGYVARTKDSKSYRQLMIDGRMWKQHRLAWLYVHGEFPHGPIDHINGDGLDNRIENLRDCDARVNAENVRKARRHNKSGLLGAHWHETYRKWYSTIVVNKKKHFLGLFKSPEEAHAAYVSAKREMHSGCTI